MVVCVIKTDGQMAGDIIGTVHYHSQRTDHDFDGFVS